MLALAAAGCRGKHADVAAHVGTTAISVKQVDRILEHARAEARNEGKDFPAEGTVRFGALRRRALDLLVFHEELAQRANMLGVTVSAKDLQPPPSAETEEDGSQNQAFVRESLRGAVLYRELYDRVTQNVSVSAGEIRAYRRRYPAQAPAQIRRNLLDTKRNALMARWVARMKREYAGKVRYEPEFRKT